MQLLCLVKTVSHTTRSILKPFGNFLMLRSKNISGSRKKFMNFFSKRDMITLHMVAINYQLGINFISSLVLIQLGVQPVMLTAGG